MMIQKLQVECFAAMIVLALSATAQAETPVVEWTRQLGTPGDDFSLDMSTDGSGNFYVTGFTSGSLDGNTNAGGWDIFMTKFDSAGTQLWTRQLGTAGGDYGYGVSVDNGGNAYVTGWTESGLDGNTSAGDIDIFLTKYDTDGIKLWTEQMGTASYDTGRGVSIDGCGNAYVTGYTEGDLDGNTNVGGRDMFLIKISSIPEPASIALLAGIALTALLYRKRKHV